MIMANDINQYTSAELGALEYRYYNHGSGHTQTIDNICFDKAKGDIIYDTDGKSYVDFNGTLNLPFGHDYTGIIETLSEEYPLNVVSYVSVPKLNLCLKLRELFMGYSSFQFYSAGTEANEGSIRYAIAITGRDGFGSFERSYHGRTRGTVSLCSMKPYNGRRLNGYFTVAYPSTEEEGRESAIILKQKLEKNKDICAGVFLEPVLGKLVVIPPVSFLRELRQICDEYGVLLIADEYLTSIRTGHISALLAKGIEPDIMTIGKCLGNGIPFAVLMCRDKYADAVSVVKGSTTFGGNPYACKTVSYYLDRLIQEDLMCRAVEVIEKSFTEVFADIRMLPQVRRVNCIGALCYIEFIDKETSIQISRACLGKGVLVSCIKSGIRITPSLTISEKLLCENLNKIKELILLRSETYD